MKQQKPSKFSVFETELMKTLIEKAKQFQGFTHPNPLVAAAIYHKNEVISWGVHRMKGGVHAEVDAIQGANDNTDGASLMVTLEPCTHTGSTPPCVSAIIKAGIKEVIFAIEDPCNLVRQKSAKTVLEEHGIQVRSGLLEKEAYHLNHDYMYFHQNKRPFIHLKAGMSLDGKIALSSGESCYITNELSRKKVHEMRSKTVGIVIGSGTLVSDNPKLTVRHGYLENKQVPPTIVVIGNKKIDDCHDYAIFESGYRSILVTSNEHNDHPSFSDVWVIPKTTNKIIDWTLFFQKCYENNMYSLLIEGGQKTFSHFLEGGIVNKCSFFIAPKLFGQADAKSVVELTRVDTLKDIFTLKNITIEQYDDDTCITGFCSLKENDTLINNNKGE
ncbi:riboflavin biosynthesis protein RibD [bacterium]|nr:riboflavin biosynthesis protein RibD [bacterium]|tara:strand:+ start:6125 stop:7282 length:1158 start_codon:yes stop_codon:yes gene_type:complete